MQTRGVDPYNKPIIYPCNNVALSFAALMSSFLAYSRSSTVLGYLAQSSAFAENEHFLEI